jgi:hypothetical protein
MSHVTNYRLDGGDSTLGRCRDLDHILMVWCFKHKEKIRSDVQLLYVYGNNAFLICTCILHGYSRNSALEDGEQIVWHVKTNTVRHKTSNLHCTPSFFYTRILIHTV